MAILSVLTAAIGVARGDENPPPAGGHGQSIDNVCGPRCVHYLIKYYNNKDEELIDLIKEIQWPDFESGSSLKDLSVALKKRGIASQVVKVRPSYTIRWPYPVIYHFKGTGGSGHFVVRLPSSTDDMEVLWAGISGTYEWPAALNANQRSEYVLLTSPTPITSLEGLAVEPGPRFSRWILGCLVASLAVATIVVVVARRTPGNPAIDSVSAEPSKGS